MKTITPSVDNDHKYHNVFRYFVKNICTRCIIQEYLGEIRNVTTISEIETTASCCIKYK